MIEKAIGYKVGNGDKQMFFPCIEEAQKHELEELFKTESSLPQSAAEIAEAVMFHQEKIMDILTTTPTSRVKGRKINGAKRRKKASTEAVNAALQDMKP